MRMTHETDAENVRVKLEIDESAGELDVAREKFESALREQLYKEEVSDSDIEDPPQQDLPSTRPLAQNGAAALDSAAAAPSSRPPRKRRRKDADTAQTGSTTASQQSSFVVRMFDRSVDLAQFNQNTPLYPICRAWLLNEPHNMGGAGGTDLSLSPSSPTNPDPPQDDDSSLPEVHFLPTPLPWASDGDETHPLIPQPIKSPEFASNNLCDGEPSTEELLEQHVHHWRNVRQSWRQAAAAADRRYERSANILRQMFSAHNNSNSEAVLGGA